MVRIRPWQRNTASGNRKDNDQQQACESDSSSVSLWQRCTLGHRDILPPMVSMGSVAAMGIYAKRPGKMVGQLFGDGFVLLWTVGWAIVGISSTG